MKIKRSIVRFMFFLETIFSAETTTAAERFAMAEEMPRLKQVLEVYSKNFYTKKTSFLTLCRSIHVGQHCSVFFHCLVIDEHQH